MYCHGFSCSGTGCSTTAVSAGLVFNTTPAVPGWIRLATTGESAFCGNACCDDSVDGFVADDCAVEVRVDFLAATGRFLLIVAFLAGLLLTTALLAGWSCLLACAESFAMVALAEDSGAIKTSKSGIDIDLIARLATHKKVLFMLASNEIQTCKLVPTHPPVNTFQCAPDK